MKSVEEKINNNYMDIGVFDSIISIANNFK
jgi:hypothetical protein